MTVATERIPLTARQQQIFDWLCEFRREKGYSPSYQELCDAFGFKTRNAAAAHLWPMRRKGWVVWEEKQTRTLRPVGGAL